MANGKHGGVSGQSEISVGIGTLPTTAVAREDRREGESRAAGGCPGASLHPDPTPEDLSTRLRDARARHDEKLARFNAEFALLFSGGRIRSFFLIPDPCWNGEMGHFLMAELGLLPYESWNLAFLPTDECAATAFGAPPHPNGNIPAFVKIATAFVRDRMARLDAARTGAPGGAGKEITATAKAECIQEIRALAAIFSTMMMAAWQTSGRPGRSSEGL
ncbi:MAG: hypothetical protein JSU82_12825 [Rhodospirillales bacterium]|nr:MAG: hypothetical protein JSU82_12825 [Rhodospirillales bacterium]